MSSKFEQLLDYLVNEEHDKANELFHEIVVEKSRTIYENLIAEEEEEEDMDESMHDEDDDSCDEGSEEDEEESMDEGFGEEDEEAETVESMFGEMEFGGDETDDLEADISDDEFGGMGGDEFGDDEFGDDEFGGEDGGEPATKGDILDLESAIEELKAEFESLMGSLDADSDGDHDMDDHEMDDEGDDMDMDMDMGDEDEGEEDEGEEDEEMKSESRKSQGETMREYIEKVTATMDGGLVGARTGETMSGPKEGKSPISSGSGKPTSGATAKNIATHQDKHSEDGQKPHGKVGGLVKTGGQFVGSGTKNVAASASAKKPDGAKLDSVKKPGNKEGQGWGSGSGDKAGQTGSVDTKSPLSGAPNRAK